MAGNPRRANGALRLTLAEYLESGYESYRECLVSHAGDL